MINPDIVQQVDEILDAHVSSIYKNQPLAQDWARVAKITEEAGEAINELIRFTGQNPRKPQADTAYTCLLNELADTAMTAVYAIQHFTKDVTITECHLHDAQTRHHARLLKAVTEDQAR